MQGSSPHSKGVVHKQSSADRCLMPASSAAHCVLLLLILSAPAVCQKKPDVGTPPSTGYTPFSTAPATHSTGDSAGGNTTDGNTTSGGTGSGGYGVYYPTPPIIIWPDIGSPNCNTPAAQNPSDVLDKKGPQIPLFYNMSAFTIKGFSKGGWPVAVDYLVPQDSLVLLTITPEGQDAITYRLKGAKGHWIVKLAIPATVGSELRVADYSVQTFDNRDVGPVSPVSVQIHGIAAGPKAVGSIGIDRLTFEPGNITKAQHQKAQYSYHSISDFDETVVYFVRVAKSKTGIVTAAAVSTKDMGNVAQDHVKNGAWDGSVDKKLIKSYKNAELEQALQSPNGLHALQVKAWLRKNHGGDFVAAISDTYVTVE